MEERQAHRRLDRSRAEVTLDPLEDGVQPDELARRVQVEQLLDQGILPVDGREPVADRSPGRATRIGRRDPGQVGVVDRAVTLVAAADLVATDGAAVVLVDRPRSRVGHGLPDDLVEDDAPAAGPAAAGVLLTEPDLERRLLARCGGDRLECRVEVTNVRRPQDDLGQQAGQRARLEGRGPALAVDGGAGDPAASTVEVDDDVAEARVRLDPGGHQLGRRRRREAGERREREARLAPDRMLSTRHGRHPATDRAFRRVNTCRPPDVPLGDRTSAPESSRDRRRPRHPSRRPSWPGASSRRRTGVPRPARGGRRRRRRAPRSRSASWRSPCWPRGTRSSRTCPGSARRCSPGRSPGRSA